MVMMLAWGVAVAEQPQGLVVGTHPIPPFVIRAEDGSWSGISVDLWAAVAEQAGIPYEIREFPIPDLVRNESGTIDVAVSLNINERSEAAWDMTHAFLSTGLAIAARPESASLWASLLGVLSPSFLALLVSVALLLVGAGALVHAIERRGEGEGGAGEGWLAGMFWAVEAVLGHYEPANRTRIGRLFGILWAGFGVVVISAVTAQLASQLTISGLESAVSGPDDLPRVRVGTVDPGAGMRYCARRALACRGYADAPAALSALAEGQIDAVVYEAPILRYHAAASWPDAIVVLPGTFDNHGYGFGLRPASPHREAIDRALLSFVASDAYRTLLTRYLGPAAE